ncbi:HAD family hydrolase [Sphingomonas morindae]|uniref:HAD family hydrolase n=1 Tax=Sphingomonas morindae TaxID=1541170 RepID=A0ABY4X4I4_9SPHN|nr:HAD family hydrolase [Sphingomonas morindae]USI71804.1 HAD family hydrolase [Sphingomonas morindae]
MARPLLISDCDEVLLHMVAHFRDWLDEAHGIDFLIHEENWGEALIRRDTGQPVEPAEVWPYLDAFFDTEMPRQQPTPGAIDALARIGAVADIVILTNLPDHRQTPRLDQLAGHGIRHRVVCNQGGKGPALRRLLDEIRPSVAVFVDDLAVQHASVADTTPEVWRLHMIAEPLVATHRPPAPAAHVRIDDWAAGADWVLDRFAEGRPAPVLTGSAARA